MISTLDPDRSRRARVLVAEDDDGFRELLAASLRADGHEVITVRNGIDLMDVLVVVSRPDTTTTSFDLVISDVRMPGITGLAAINQLKTLIRLPPVVFISSFAGPLFHQKAEAAGAAAVFDKPVDLDELRAVVKGILASKSEYLRDHGS